jgi:hypothetical protein
MKLLNFLIAIGLSITLNAQNNLSKNDDIARISLKTIVPAQVEGLTFQARQALMNKMNSITLKNGIGGAQPNERFVFVSNVDIETKEITSTAPAMHMYVLNLNLYIGDGIEGNLFASTSLRLKGAARTDTKAYIAAIKQINVNSDVLQEFLDEGKTKIIQYYNDKCDFILKEAEMLEKKANFAAAIAKLVAVPEVCKECYNKAMDAVAPIYQKQIDYKCKQDYSMALNAWNSDQNSTGADNASMYLSRIDPNSSCYADSKKLAAQIAKRILEINDREWAFELKQQQDNVDIQKASIKAARDIGVAYGEGQPQNITYNYRGWLY